MKKAILLLFVSSMLLTSCGSGGLELNIPEEKLSEKKPDESPVSEGGTLLKREIQKKYGASFNNAEIEYEYDENDRLVLKTSLRYDYNAELDSLWSTYSTFEYTEDRVIASISRLEGGPATQYHEIKVSENQINFEIHYPDGTSYVRRHSYLEGAACGFTRSELFNKDGELEYYFTTQYTDSNCSGIATSYNNEGVMDGQQKWTNDAHNSPFTSTRYHHLYGNLSYHNIIEEESTYADGDTYEDSSSTSEYIYNEDNYPISKITTESSGHKSVYLYEYY